MQDIDIVPLTTSRFESLRQVLDTVAKEKHFLAFTSAPDPGAAYAFYDSILTSDRSVSRLALTGGETIGWCDVLSTHGQAREHVGTLGIGLLKAYRHRGIGIPLMQATIEAAQRNGFTRLELTVRSDNLSAKRLYERIGFVDEGLLRKAFRIDGQYHDAYTMALLL